MKNWYLSTIAILALAGCGGGGNSGNDIEAQSIVCEPAVDKFSQETAQNAGLYRGFLEVTEGETVAEGFAILTSSGRLAFLSANGPVTGLFSDSLQVSGNVSVWSSETERQAYPLNGVFSARDSIQGYNLVGGDYDFRAQYQVPNEDICWPTVDPTGSWSQTSDGQTTTLTFDSNDQFTGSDSTGCVYAGSVSAQAIEGGVFELNATVSNCEKAGDYIGVGAVIGVQPATADLIFGVLWNDSRNIGFSLER